MTLKRPLIGCATYQKVLNQESLFEMCGLMPTYIRAIVAAGGLPVLIPLELKEDDLAGIFERVDGVLIPGGGDIRPSLYGGDDTFPTLYGIDDRRDFAEFWLVQQAVEQEKPLFCICRGHQVFNVALGGTLWEDIASQTQTTVKHDNFKSAPGDYLAHEVRLMPNSHLSATFAEECIPVNSLHHQGIKKLAPALTATAYAPDGLIEGVEMSDHRFAVGVQWHPEKIVYSEAPMLGLFQRFVQMAS